ncbi:MAG TPA: M12 family metallo-peptidase [Pyrinomonadaceae bacterium]|nr:M12 family metallo-peptidase [Pyrinomonadaceae bacterium]
MNRRKYPRATMPALALCLFAAAAMLVSPAASGQKGGRVAEEIGQVLTSFETVTLDPGEVVRSVREQGSVALQTARGTFDLVVEPYDIRSDNYRATAVGADGVTTELPRTPSNSWRGKVRGRDDTVVRLYLDGQKVQGIIITPTETFFVEPARDLSAAAGSKEFVFYEASSVKQTDASCVEVSLGGKVAAEAAKTRPAAATSGSTPPADELFGPKRQAEIAAEADFEFFQANGGDETATKNDIESIITQVDGIYDAELGVRVLRLVETRVWKTSSDPYDATNASALLTEFANKYDDTFGVDGPPPRDFTHLFTGKNIDTNASDGDTIGIAFRGVVCNLPAYAYGISQSRFVNQPATSSLRVGVTAHEIGHNFGATHTDTENPVPTGCDQSLMNSSVQGTNQFCQFSKDQITTHITANGNIPVNGVACLLPQATAGCNYDITPTSRNFPVAGGTGTVAVTTANCPWGVAEGASWLNFDSQGGTGSGSVGYTVAANTGKDGPRRAFVDIGGRQLAITQPASPACLASATAIGIGQTLAGALASSDCNAAQPGRETAFADLYTFSARAGQRVRITMSTTGSPGIDTYLYLIGPDGSVVIENDDIEPEVNTNSRIPPAAGQFLELPQTGVYTIIATTFDTAAPGSYTLSLLENGVSLSSAAYAVSEGTGGNGLGTDGTGFRVVTVTRSGDTSGTATVDYATSDGTASRLSDYEQALGTLVFGPNETTKTFNVFVPDDAFQEGPETVTLTLSNPVGTILGANPTATLTINSNDDANGPSPVRKESFNANFFTRQQYLDFLNREPDLSGFQHWRAQTAICADPPPADLTVCRVNVSAAFFQSIEFQETGFLAYRTYKAAYGDRTEPSTGLVVPIIRLNEFLPDSQRISKGVVVGFGGWELQLEANKQAYMLEFVQRPRFLAAFPLTMTSAEFVDQLVSRAGITLTAGERDALIAQLGGNPSAAAARAAVLYAVAENPQLKAPGTIEFRRAFVLMQYYGYLRRDPDTGPNTDFSGWNFWLSKLNDANGNFIQAEMVKAFLESFEYIDRFGTRP